MEELTEDTFSTKLALWAGWRNLKQHWGLWILIELFIVFGCLGFERLELDGLDYLIGNLEMPSGVPFFWFMTYIKLISGLILSVGVTRIVLDFQDHDKSGFFQLFSQAQKIFVLFITGLFAHMIIVSGYFMLVFPGIYFSLHFSQLIFLVVEKKIGPITALRKSGRLTKGVKLQLLGFYIVLALINLIGAALLGFGLIITLPVTWGAMAYVYRKLHMRAFGVYAQEG